MADTATICIGNSDDKLSQFEWSQFVCDVHDLITRWNFPIHFHGCSAGSTQWQNACWVIYARNLSSPDHLPALRYALAEIAKTWRQDSIALVLGDTEFVAPIK